MGKELITTFKKYKESYENRLEEHKATYEDYDELHFINSELGFYQICHMTANVSEQRLIVNNKDYTEYEYRFINEIEYNDIYQIDSNINENYDIKELIKDESKWMTDGYNLEICEQLTTSFTKITEYLNIKKNKLTNNNEFPKVKFHGSPTEFIELIKALTENGNLKGIQKDNIEICSNFFDIEIKNPTKLISDINNTRNTGSETLFLDKLKKSLYTYIQQQNQKK
ncbi:RteC domain-containing protein [Flavobacterium soyangense]|uniref:RteC domain-containing protein n=1 Tax=Flavobacterium soyangense TaxID=2023265 RepID=A0A930UDC7_9FLAO|nr:RteC domain-containing protein [Flavobacterium soyangense]MBF2710000.1 RteC domain-containing protein [Flavobacterium soyangense]